MADIKQPKTSTPALILKDFPVGFPCQSFCSGITNETPPKSAATVQAAHDQSAQRQQCFLPPTTLTKKNVEGQTLTHLLSVAVVGIEILESEFFVLQDLVEFDIHFLNKHLGFGSSIPLSFSALKHEVLILTSASAHPTSFTIFTSHRDRLHWIT